MFEKFSAIFHKDTSEFEVLWTAFTLSPAQKQVNGRTFDFEFNDQTHACRFGRSSDRLLTIVNELEPQSTSETNFRNTQSFNAYTRIPEHAHAVMFEDGPVSFWMSSMPEDQANIVEIATNINYYMTYFDDLSPLILVHEPPTAPVNQRTRYLKGGFPSRINGNRSLDPNLLSFWNFASTAGNPMINFILYYRIIEYAAFHYVESATRAELRRILMAPEFSPTAMSSVEKIVAAIGPNKTEEIQRFRSVMKHCVDPKLLWPDVKSNTALFANQVTFDGGFAVSPLIGSA